MRRAAVVLSVLAIVSALGFFASRVAERGRYASPYSTLGGGPDGSMATLRLVRALGYDARIHTRELSHMRGPGTLIALGSCRSPLVRELSRPEREALLKWIEAGGLLIVAGVDGYAPEEAGLYTERNATCEDLNARTFIDSITDGQDESMAESADRVPFTIMAVPSGAPLAHMVDFPVSRAATVVSRHEDGATVLIESDEGPLALTTTLGRGRVVLLGIPDAFVNQSLWAAGGPVLSRLLRSFAPKGPVLFDEYHLGVGERRSILRYLRDLGYGPALLQFALVLLALLVFASARLGPVRPPRVPPPRTTRSYLSALGSLYARTKDKASATHVLSQRARERVAQHYRMGQTPLPELAGALDARGLSAVARLVERITRLGDTPLESGESLEQRATRIDEDAQAAMALGDAP